jgi:TolB protein
MRISGLIKAIGVWALGLGTLLFYSFGHAQNRIYVSVGDPNFKKVLIAVEPTQNKHPATSEFFKTLVDDLEYTGYFEMLPANKIPSNRGGLTLGTFSFNPYKALGVEFLIKSELRTNAGKVEAELRLYDVNRGVQILGRLYPFVSKDGSPGRELAHFSGNDIMKTLTGDEGIFRTRLLMSCGNKNKEIYIMDFDGANVKKLTRDGNFALSPSWAPDGRRVLFTSYKPAARGAFVNPNLYLLDLVSNKRTTLSAAIGLNTGGVFHPKENKIAYTFSQKGRPEIWVLDLDSNTRTKVTDTQFFTVEPDWSPDGTQMTYSSSRTGSPHIYVGPPNRSSPPRRLTFAGVYNSSPKFSPDGKVIVFSGQENKLNNFNIFRVDVGGSNLVRLTAGSHSSENPVWSPDGRFVAFSSNIDGQYRIYVMSNLGTNIRVLSPKNLGHCKQPAWSPRL